MELRELNQVRHVLLYVHLCSTNQHVSDWSEEQHQDNMEIFQTIMGGFSLPKKVRRADPLLSTKMTNRGAGWLAAAAAPVARLL